MIKFKIFGHKTSFPSHWTFSLSILTGIKKLFQRTLKGNPRLTDGKRKEVKLRHVHVVLFSQKIMLGMTCAQTITCDLAALVGKWPEKSARN